MLDAGAKFVYNGKVYTKLQKREKGGTCACEDGTTTVFPLMMTVEPYDENVHGKRRKKKVAPADGGDTLTSNLCESKPEIEAQLPTPSGIGS